jgi:AraC family transcriptional regulator
MQDQVADAQRNLTKSFPQHFEKQEVLAKVIEFFPYPIQIFSLDGTARLINKATLEMIGIKSIECHVGKYNVFEDPIVRKLGAIERIRQVLSGKTVYLADFNVLYQDLIRHFNYERTDYPGRVCGISHEALRNIYRYKGGSGSSLYLH